MRFSLLALVALAAPAVFAASLQNRAADLASQVQDQLTFAAEEASDRLDDPCPDLLVRCVRTDEGNEKVVGDIGKKTFKHKGGLKCEQAHSKLNKAECNAKYPIECATHCEAVGSPI